MAITADICALRTDPSIRADGSMAITADICALRTDPSIRKLGWLHCRSEDHGKRSQRSHIMIYMTKTHVLTVNCTTLLHICPRGGSAAWQSPRDSQLTASRNKNKSMQPALPHTGKLDSRQRHPYAPALLTIAGGLGPRPPRR